MGLTALLFDFDGTIAETERDGHRVAYNRAFADLGLDWHWGEDLYGDLLSVAGGKERIAHFIATESPARPHGDDLLLANRIHERKAARFSELAAGITLRPGIARLIAEAHAAGIKLGIATTASEAGVCAVLSYAPDTLAAFDVIAAGDVVPNKKPAPDVYTYALAALGVSARETIAIEDTAIGLAAARAANVATIVTPSTYSARESFAGASAVLSSLGDHGCPSEALSGPAPPSGMVTIAYLRDLVAV